MSKIVNIYYGEQSKNATSKQINTLSNVGSAYATLAAFTTELDTDCMDPSWNSGNLSTIDTGFILEDGSLDPSTSDRTFLDASMQVEEFENGFEFEIIDDGNAALGGIISQLLADLDGKTNFVLAVVQDNKTVHVLYNCLGVAMDASDRIDDKLKVTFKNKDTEYAGVSYDRAKLTAWA